MLFFRNNLELKRFKLILQCLHFTSNDAESNDDIFRQDLQNLSFGS